jgi:hypothetical protein
VNGVVAYAKKRGEEAENKRGGNLPRNGKEEGGKTNAVGGGGLHHARGISPHVNHMWRNVGSVRQSI